MERDEALKLLEAIKGSDLVQIASKNGMKIFHEKEVEGAIKRTLNKGWAGLTLETYLGLPRNSRREPNGGSWELKQVSVRNRPKTGEYTAKETMQITMFDKAHVLAHPFEQSHVLHKIQRMIVVARLYVDKEETRSPVVIVREADISLASPDAYEQVKSDYEMIRSVVDIQVQTKTISGTLLEIRTKGQKNSRTYAFYARRPFVNLLLGIV